MNLFKKNQMTLKEIERFMDAKRKREAKMRETTKKNKINAWLFAKIWYYKSSYERQDHIQVDLERRRQQPR